MDAPEIWVGLTLAKAANFNFQAPKQTPVSPRRWNRPEDA
jgi:hypothetical protein